MTASSFLQHRLFSRSAGNMSRIKQKEAPSAMQMALQHFRVMRSYSRSLRFQLIKSPSVVEEDEDEEDCEEEEVDCDGPEDGPL